MVEFAGPVAAERLACLGRAAVEHRRFASPRRDDLSETLTGALHALDEKRRGTLLDDVVALTDVGGRRPEPAEQRLGGETSKGAVHELMQQRAKLELQVKAEQKRADEKARELKQEREDHQEAVSSLSLQQKQLKELQDERARLLKDHGEIESRLRLQINETEQANLRYEKLKAARQAMGDQATELAETINELKADNERLRKEAEVAKQQRDVDVSDAHQAVDVAEGQTEDAAYKLLWARMHEKLPDVFVLTHVPKRRTFEAVCDALVEFAGTYSLLEQHVQYMLEQLRQAGERGDKLNHFRMMFKKSPGVLETLRDALVTGKRASHFVNMVRALQSWARAFATGVYKVVVRSPAQIGKELNYKGWDFKKGALESEEAAIGKHFKEVMQRQIPDSLGTELRKMAGDMAYEDYNSLMKRNK